MLPVICQRPAWNAWLANTSQTTSKPSSGPPMRELPRVETKVGKSHSSVRSLPLCLSVSFIGLLDVSRIYCCLERCFDSICSFFGLFLLPHQVTEGNVDS
jgi:hypothetical protein